jgi:hypothetical protein
MDLKREREKPTLESKKGLLHKAGGKPQADEGLRK